MGKPLWKSKVLWVNALGAILAFFPGLQSFATPETIAIVLAVINFGLRFVTKEPVTIS